MVDHSSVDFARDTISSVVAGLLLMAIGGVLAYFRHVRDRLTRHATEIRHIEKEASIQPFYPHLDADKL